jgi:hypothetical protein
MKKFQGSILVEIRATEEDIQRYLDSCILESESAALKSCQEEIKTKITEAVDWMYASSLLFDGRLSKLTST